MRYANAMPARAPPAPPDPKKPIDIALAVCYYSIDNTQGGFAMEKKTISIFVGTAVGMGYKKLAVAVSSIF